MFEALFYALQTAVAIALPLIIKARIDKHEAAKKTFGAGIIVYLLFAVINSVVQVVIINSLEITSAVIMNPWVSAIFSGCIFTVCLTVGRIIWIKYIMKKADKKVDGLVFGTGYSLAMCIVTYALSGIVSCIFAVMKALESTKAVPSVFHTTAQIVADGNVYTIFLITLQLILLCVLEICISAILFTSIKKLSGGAFFLLAVLFSTVAHTFLESPLETEIRLIILAVTTILSAAVCWRCTKKE